MARMRPPYVSEHTRSQAERDLFGAIRDELPNDWTVLHSLGLAIHQRKPWAEADFVLVGPPGVFCLEVKGQRVRREDGKWIYTTRDGRDSEPKFESPFDQAGGASSALHDYIGKNLPDLRGAASGYGVATPDIRFNVSGPDIELATVYDADDVGRPFSEYVSRLTTYWHGRLTKTRGRAPTGLDERARDRVVDLLRGDFDGRLSLRGRADAVSRELLRLTREQYAVLDGLIDNERALIRGGAGTGKTLLAAEESGRLADEGQRVLLTCFNRNLADFLATTMKAHSGVTVANLHGLMADIVARAGLMGELPDASESDLFEVFYPELAYKALVDGLVPDRFDVLIVDEAQDLMTPAYLDVFDALLSSGLDQSRWRMFYDARQDMFLGKEPKSFQRVRRLAAQYTLSVNCRNTMPIAVMTGLLSGSAPTETLRVDGDDVELQWYGDAAEEQRLIGRTLNRLLSSGFRPEDIVVLSHRRLEGSVLAHGVEGVAYAVADRASDAKARPHIRFSTVQGFKGLEADAVLLIDIDDLASGGAAASTYVGASRARALLSVFLSTSVRDDYLERAGELGRQIAVAEERHRP
jgi:hypothetical protein